MDAIRLEDIIPEGSTFTLKQTGKTYRIRPINLADEIWLNETFREDIEPIFKEIRMKEVCRIAFRLMHPDDQVDFTAQTVRIIDEEGVWIEKQLGGAQLLFTLISGIQEKLQIFEALLKAIGAGRPLLERAANQAVTEKKSHSQPTGQPSSISSPMSMAGLPITSSPEPHGKLPSDLQPLPKGKSWKRNSKPVLTTRNLKAQ